MNITNVSKNHNMNKILTIVIPTYNMEKFLQKCLDSLLIKDNQDLIEVLIVNDGSKDSSSDIAHEYEKKYPHMYRVIDKENGNYGSCINVALKIATGKYIRVLDADDWYDTSNFNSFIEQLKHIEADLVISDYRRVFATNKTFDVTFNILQPNKLYGNEILKEKALIKVLMHAVTYKREILKELNYKQQEGISYTDQEWVFTPMARVKIIAYIKENVYQYFLGREGQTMDHSVFVKNYTHELLGVKKMIKEYHLYHNNTPKDVTDYWERRIINRILILCRIYLLELPDKKEEFDTFMSSIYEQLPFWETRIKEKRDPIIYLIKRWEKHRKHPNRVLRIIYKNLYKVVNQLNLI